MRKRIQFSKRFWLTYCLAWFPYSLSYIAVFLTQSSGDFTKVFFAMCRNVAPAAIFGIAVIWFCNRLNWSLHKRFWFFPIHVFSATVYSFVWASTLFLLLTVNLSTQRGVWTPVSFVGNALQWQVFSGMMIYATIASVVYVLQVVQNLHEEERRAVRAEALYAQNALASLQAQLNPNFLFNTLHSLMALVRYNPHVAEDALEKLAEMLRYSLKDKRDSGHHLVRLESELQFVENYLGLEKLRLGDRLAVEKEIESDALNCLLPAFTIQPLVENSIKHGIAPKNTPATIFISAKKENGFLKLEVRDDGMGATDEQIEESAGLGVNLVRRQLQIQYEEKSVFKIQAKLNEGFKISIEIPVQYALNSAKEKLKDEYSRVNS